MNPNYIQLVHLKAPHYRFYGVLSELATLPPTGRRSRGTRSGQRYAPVEAKVERPALPAPGDGGATAAFRRRDRIPALALVLVCYGCMTRAGIDIPVPVALPLRWIWRRMWRLLFVLGRLGGVEQDAHPETAVQALHHEHEVVLVLLQLRLGELEAALVAAAAGPEVYAGPLVEAQVVEIDGLDAGVEARGHGVPLLRRGGCG